MGNSNSSEERDAPKRNSNLENRRASARTFPTRVPARGDDPLVDQVTDAILGKLVQVGQPSTHSGQQPNLSQANYPRQQDTAAQPTSQPASLPFQPCNQAQQPHAGQQVGPNNYPPLTGQVPNFGPQNPPNHPANQQFASYLGPQPNYGQLPSPENRFQGPPPPIPVSTPYPANVPPAPNTATDYLGGPIRMHPVQHQPFMHPGPPPMQPPPPYHPIGQPLFNQGARMNHPYTPPQYQRGRGGYNGRGNRGNQNNRNVRQAGPNQWNNRQQNQNRIPPQNANKNAAQNKGNPGSNSSESDISDKKSNPSQKKGQPNAGKGGKIASEANKSNKNENKGPGNQAGGAQKSGGPQEAKNQQKKKKERALFLQSDGVQADNKVEDFLEKLQLTEPPISKKENMTLSDLAHMYSNRDDDDVSIAVGPRKKTPLPSKLDDLALPSDSSETDSDDDTASEKTFATARDTVAPNAKKHGKQLKPKRKGPTPSKALSKSNPGKKAFLYKFILDGIPTLDGATKMGIPQKQFTRQVEGFLLVSEASKLTVTPKTVMDILAFKQSHPDGKLSFVKSKAADTSKSGQ